MMDRPNVTRLHDQQSWLELEFEAREKVYTYRFQSMELPNVMQLFNTLASDERVHTCDIYLCNDKARFVIGDKETLLHQKEEMRKMMLQNRGGIL